MIEKKRIVLENHFMLGSVTKKIAFAKLIFLSDAAQRVE